MYIHIHHIHPMQLYCKKRKKKKMKKLYCKIIVLLVFRSSLHYSVVVVLIGANIDTLVLSRCLDRGLVADGRLATFRVIIRDRPGGLSELLQLIAKHQVYITVFVLAY